MGYPRPLILGCQGPELTRWELDFFGRTDPLGFILFKRNCVSRLQVQNLVAALRTAVNRPEAPVLIDQEGGRVARLTPPEWGASPPAAIFGTLFELDPSAAVQACWLNYRAIAADLKELGIDVNCAPVLDIRIAGAHEIVGDRAFSNDLGVALRLARTACDAMRSGGVLPVIKHIPGHGRALVDSHESLPRVSAASSELQGTDYVPFLAFADQPIAMTAHIVYEALDASRPATTSEIVVQQTIRKRIGFSGLLLTDDLSMKALSGSMGLRAKQSLEAGCDILLHCNGDRAEMEEVAAVCTPMNADAWAHAERALAGRSMPAGFDPVPARRERDALLGALYG